MQATSNSGRWNRTEISAMYNWGDSWIIGEKDTPQMPTDREVEDFKVETWRNEGADRFRTVFEGTVEIEKPTTVRR